MRTDQPDAAGAAASPWPPARGQRSVRRLRFGSHELDLDSGELRHAGEPRPLRPLAAKALELLVANPHRLVTREELRRHLWGEAALEWENGLHQLIRQLRRALGDDPRGGRYIATVPRRGYRWIAPLAAAPPAADPRRPTTPPRTRRWKGAGLFLAGAASLPLALLLACLLADLIP